MDQLRQNLYISHMNSASHIRSYNLFGETAELADELHVETIRARSERHDWELKPHRHARLHQLLVLTGGGGAAELDGNTHPLPPPCLVNVPRGCVHGFRFGNDTAGWVLTLSSELLDQSLRAEAEVQMLLDRPSILPLPEAMQALAEQIHTEHQRPAFGRAQLLRGLALAATARTARAIAAADPSRAETLANPLFSRFETLVDSNFRQRLPLAAYARELAVSATHLNRITHQATGQPASALIRARTLREARRLLIYTTLSAAQIAYELGFADPAHFSRYFAKGTGVPPRKFRQQLADKGASAAG